MYDTLFSYWLASTDGIGPRTFLNLRALFPNPEEPFADPELLRRAKVQQRYIPELLRRADRGLLEEELFRLARRGIGFIGFDHPDYPENLKRIYDPPIGLYIKGDFSRLSKKRLGIVGTRQCSYRGQDNVRRMAKALSEAGVSVVSGMARGIDSAAHTGALQGKTATVAVLGCGVDVIYPPENHKLYEQICEQGAVISEYKPGTAVARMYFPGRNRIISGMCPGVLIAEGKEKSGAAITANYAVSENRDVFALPGDVSQPQSALPNRLISEGAQIVLGTNTILEYYGWSGGKGHAAPAPAPLDFLEQELYNLLIAGDLCASDLVEKSGLTAQQVSGILTMLEVSGLVERLPGNLFRAVGTEDL